MHVDPVFYPPLLFIGMATVLILLVVIFYKGES